MYNIDSKTQECIYDILQLMMKKDCCFARDIVKVDLISLVFKNYSLDDYNNAIRAMDEFYGVSVPAFKVSDDKNIIHGWGDAVNFDLSKLYTFENGRIRYG